MPERNPVIKKQKDQRNLQNRYTEALDHILELEDEHRYWSTELQYLNDYIHYKNLDEDYQYFRENAHEERDENLPFAFYTL